MFILYEGGVPTTLREGDVLSWNPTSNVLSVLRSGNHSSGTLLRWDNNDDKQLLPFLKDHPLAFDAFIRTTTAFFGFGVVKTEECPQRVRYTLVKRQA